MRRPRPRGGKPPHRHKPTQSPPGRWVIGLHSVKEVLRVRPKAIAELLLKEGWESHRELRELADKVRQVQTRPLSVLERYGAGHQGVAARVTEEPPFSWEKLETSTHSWVLLLDGIQDPHNLGACLRSAWLLGAQAIFISEHRSSPLTPTAMKVASGGAEHVPVVTAGNLSEVANTLKDKGFWLFGLSHKGPKNLWQSRFPEKVALVIGSEESGLRTPVERFCDELVRIPQGSEEASYNASVAAAIALAEVARQHSQSIGKP